MWGAFCASYVSIMLSHITEMVVIQLLSCQRHPLYLAVEMMSDFVENKSDKYDNKRTFITWCCVRMSKRSMYCL